MSTLRDLGRKAWADAPTRLRSLMGSWVGALAGASFYGSLVATVNWDAGPEQALRSAMGHALISAVLTVVGTGSMRAVHSRHAPASHRTLMTFLAGMLLTYILLISVHLLLNTQRIFLSLVPGIVPNILFCATYSRLLTHDSLRTRPDQCLAQSHLAAFQECTP